VEEDEIFAGRDFVDCLDDGLGGVGRGGENFEHAEAAGCGIDPDTVSEGASSVDGDAQGLGAAGHEWRRGLG
jgi:hypothetical protein